MKNMTVDRTSYVDHDGKALSELQVASYVL